MESTTMKPATELSVPATWVRGGTSKCWIFRASDVDVLPVSRDEFLLRAFGSPDLRQIDGIGGATSTTSKTIIVEDGDPGQAAVRYSFAQVSVDQPRVEWMSNCGNCATALALYAVQQGLVRLDETATEFALVNHTTGLILGARVPTPGGVAPTHGTQAVRGVPFLGVPVDLAFGQDTWSTFGSFLPTGRPVDVLTVNGADYAATLIDAGAPVAVVSARAVGLTGADDVDAVAARMPFFAELRRSAARAMGLPDGDQSVPKVGVVGPGDASADVNVRMISMSAPHPAIGLTSAVAIAAAATLPGSLVHDVAPASPDYRIGTLSGAIEVQISHNGDQGTVAFRRSARRIADALVYIPPVATATGHLATAAGPERVSTTVVA